MCGASARPSVLSPGSSSRAIRHTPSGHAGGQFTVRIWSKPGWALMTVADEGAGQWHPLRGDTNDEYGRGLAIVAALADRLGHDLTTGGAQTVWAEITWPEHPGHS